MKRKLKIIWFMKKKGINWGISYINYKYLYIFVAYIAFIKNFALKMNWTSIQILTVLCSTVELQEHKRV